MSNRGNMGLGEVHDVDVIANAGPVGRGPIRTENTYLGQLPRADLRKDRHEIVGRR